MMNDSNNNSGEPCTREGHLQLKITKFSEFAREEDARRRSEPVHVLGFKWIVYASVKDYDNPADSEPVQKCLGFYLQCIGNNDEEDKDSTLSCTAKRHHCSRSGFRSVSAKWSQQLAARSNYFECFSFGEGYKESSNIELELPGNVDHFKRMLDTMQPDNVPLDDQCIEGVFHLANQFLLGDVEIKCRNFLAKESKRSAIFKYRLADKYGFDTLKKQILDLPKEEFSKDADFFENLQEYAKLDGKARETLNARIGQLFGIKNVVAQ